MGEFGIAEIFQSTTNTNKKPAPAWYTALLKDESIRPLWQVLTRTSCDRCRLKTFDWRKSQVEDGRNNTDAAKKQSGKIPIIRQHKMPVLKRTMEPNTANRTLSR